MQPKHNAVRHVLRWVTFGAHHSLVGVNKQGNFGGNWASIKKYSLKDLYLLQKSKIKLFSFVHKALHGPNVLGTQNIIKFACDSKIKPLHYISTDAVFPHGLVACREDADMTMYADTLDDGYSQSKWVAEQLVKHAMDRGLPAAIYRLGKD